MVTIIESINSFTGILIHTIITYIPTIITYIPTIIFFLLILFIVLYILPAIVLLYRLWRLRKTLKAFKQSNQLDYPTNLFNQSKQLADLWAEYKKTLHEQRSLNSQTGVEEFVAIRSTVPADALFSPSVLVDSQLHAEFFKHLPGILTGLGIIAAIPGLLKSSFRSMYYKIPLPALGLSLEVERLEPKFIR